MISYGDRIKAVGWADVKDEVALRNPDLAKTIDELDPPDYYRIYRVKYHYGDDILKQGVLHLPFLLPHK